MAACKTFNMAAAWRIRWRPFLSAAIVAAVAGSVVAKNVAQMSVLEIEDAIQVSIYLLGTEKREWPGAMGPQKLIVSREAR